MSARLRLRVRLAGFVVAALGLGLTSAVPSGPASAQPPTPPAAAKPLPARTDPSTAPFDPDKLRITLDAAHEAGMYGLYSAVRRGDQYWRGASGVADVRTQRSVRADMEHRVGSITKTFTATAVLMLVEQGRLNLDAPIATYMPETVPGERGQRTTVRMLLNHTSGIADYITNAFPSFPHKPLSLDEGRFRELRPSQLIAWGLAAPPTHAPGAGWAYSNTNYILLGQLLEKTTGMRAETYIDRHIIKPAGLRNTYFPTTPFVQGRHSRQYEALHGGADPPHEYSVYDMSWTGTAGALVSTVDDLNRFYRALFTGKLIGTGTLVEMRRTVPVQNEDGDVIMNYGLGLYALTLPCGTFWGHDGIVFGAGTQALSSPDGRKQIALGHNLTKYQELNGKGVPVPHAIDNAMGAHMVQALCGGEGPLPIPATRQAPPLPLQYLSRH